MEKSIGPSEISGRFTANVDSLVNNFGYFETCMKYSTTRSFVLDFGFNSELLECCCNLSEVAELHNEMDYDDVIGVLEICNVLQCKNQIFLDKLVSNVVNRLDVEEYETVCTFNEKLKSSDKINSRLRDNIKVRILYRINASMYFPVTNRQNETYPDCACGKIMLVIYPKIHWRLDDRCSEIKDPINYSNWGELYVFNHQNELTKIVYAGKDTNCIVCMSIMYMLRNENLENGETRCSIHLYPFLNKSDNRININIMNKSRFKFLVVSGTSSEFVDCDIKGMPNDTLFSTPHLGHSNSVFVLNLLYKIRNCTTNDPNNNLYLL